MTIIEARDLIEEINALTYIAECLAAVQEKGKYHAPAVCLVAEQMHERCDRLDEHHKSLAVTPPPTDHVHQEDA